MMPKVKTKNPHQKNHINSRPWSSKPSGMLTGSGPSGFLEGCYYTGQGA